MKKILFFLIALCFAITGWTQTPLNEGFDGTMFPPDDWTTVNEKGTVYWERTTGNSPRGTASATVNYASAGHQNWLITPKLNVTTGLDTISFWIKTSTYYANTSLTVFVSSTTNDISSFDTINPALLSLVDNQITTTWTKYSIPLTNYIGQDIFIGFRVKDQNGMRIMLDDITGPNLFVPTCPKPKTLITSNPTITGVDLGWTDPTGTIYNIQYMLNNETDWANATTISGVTNPYTFTTLNHSSYYKARVQRECVSEQSEWSTPITFNTACDAISVFPWIEGFENGFQSAAVAPGNKPSPLCWYIIDSLNTGTYFWKTSSTANTGSGAIYMLGYGSATTTTATYNNNDWLISPVLSLTGGERLNFWAKKSSDSYKPDLLIYAMDVSLGDLNSTASNANFVLIGSVDTMSLTTTYQNYEYFLNSLVGNYRLAFVRKKIANGSVYLDDIKISDIPNCLKPTNIASSNKTTNSIDLSWTNGAPSNNAWYIYYKNLNATNWDSVLVTTNPFTLTSLTQNSSYQAYLRTYCGTELSEASVIHNFTTACGIISSFPWTEGFESPWISPISPSNTSSPLCWTNINKGAGTTNLWSRGTTTHSGTGAAQMFTDNTSKNNDWLITPMITLTGNERLRFWAQNYSSTTTEVDEISIWVSDGIITSIDTTNMGQYDSIQGFIQVFQTGIPIGPWQEYEINLSQYIGNRYIAFVRRNTPDNGWYLRLDDITIDNLPSCIKPTNLAAINLTTTSIDLSWTNGDVNDFAWWVYYKQAGSTGFDSVYATTNPYTLTSLNPASKYEIYIRTDCGAMVSQETTSIFATTLCIPIDGLIDLPWNEGFETLTADNTLPACWSATSFGSKTKTQITDYSSNNRVARTGTSSAYFVYGCNDKFTTPQFDLYAGQNYSFSFWYITDGLAGWQNLQLRARSVADTSISIVLGSPVVNPNNTTYQVYVGDFSPTQNGLYEFIIECQATGSPWYLTIDDIKLEVSTCAMPQNVSLSNITATSVDMNWDLGTNGQWLVEHKLSTDSIWTSDLALMNAYSFTNLTPNSNYDFRIASICGSDTSMFITLNQTTLCLPVFTFPYTENFDSYGTSSGTRPDCWSFPITYSGHPSIVSGNAFSDPGSLHLQSETTNPTYAITPQLGVDINTLKVKFKLKREGVNSGTIEVGVMSNNLDSNTFESVQIINPADNNYHDYEVSFRNTSLSGANNFIAFKHNSILNNWFYWIDDVNIDYIPACEKPTNITSNNLTTTSADISWTPGNSTDIAWWIYYSIVGSNLWDSVYATMNPYTLNMLNPATSYEYYLRTDCGTEISDSTSRYFFTTLCVPISTLPYTESFDTYGTTSGTRPACWSFPVINSGNPSIVTTNNSAPGSLRFRSLPSQPTYAISPQFTSDINALRVRFMLRAESLTNSGTLTVGVMSDPNDTTTFEPVLVITPTNTTFNPYEVSFIGTTISGGNNYIAFKQNANLDNWFFWLDDVIIDSIPSCPKPTSLSSSNITTNSADINWVAGSQTTNNWWLYWKESSATSYDSVYVSNVLSYSFTNLNPNTVYEYYMITDCSTELSEQTSVYNFRTACAIISSVPWSDYFDTYSTGTSVFPNCWTRNTTYADRPYINSTNFTAPGSMYFYSSSTTYNIAATPQFDVSIPINTLQASFMLRKTSAAYELIVGVMTDPAIESTFVPIDTVSPSATSTWEAFDVNFSSYTGSGQYIAFKSQLSATNAIYLDNLDIYTIPTCTRPNAPTVSNPTQNSIDVAWTDPNVNNTLYKVYYRILGDTTWSVVNNATSPTTINGLNHSTTYQIAIATDCITEESLLTAVVSARTLCGAMSIPTPIESFLTVLPNTCWARFTGQLLPTGNPTLTASTSGWISNNYVSPNNIKANLYSSAQYYWLVTPSIDLAGGAASNRLEFDLFLTDYGNGDAPDLTDGYTDKRFIVLISTDDGATWSATNALKTWDNLGSADTLNSLTNTIKHISIPLVDATNTPYSGIVKFAFYAESTASSQGDNDLHIDNFQVIGQVCDAPTNVTANSITYNSANITWVAGGNESSWQIKEGSAGTPVDVSATTYALTNLTPNTAYTYYVRSNCGTSYSSWVSVTFTTDNAPTIPVVTTSPVTVFTHNSATFTGSFVEGSEVVGTTGFNYMAQSSSSWINIPINPVANPFNYNATGLLPNTTYKVVAFVVTNVGMYYGDTVTFTTNQYLLPTVTTDTAIVDQTTKSAVFQGTTAQGTDAIIARGFEYKYDSLDWSTAIDLTANGSTNITATATSLFATKYSVRAYAETLERGKTYGEVKTFVITSGLNSIDTDNLNVNLYPNPASNNTTLSIKGINGKVKISITDVQGRTISTLEREITNGEVNHSINLEAYAKGVYYIRIQSDNSIKTQKLIVQ